MEVDGVDDGEEALQKLGNFRVLLHFASCTAQSIHCQ